MKKIFISVLIITIVAILCGCDSNIEPENKKIVTACSVQNYASGNVYRFYVSVPSGEEGNDDGSNVSSAKVYQFSADNFSNAIDKFVSDGGGEIDMDHVSLFISNENYINEYIKYDEKHIRSKIKMSPMVNFCVNRSSDSDIFDCITSEYDGNVERFATFMFENSNKDVSCSISDIALSLHNRFYTSVIPTIKVTDQTENPLVEICALYFYNLRTHGKFLDGNDMQRYRDLINQKGRNTISDAMFIKNGRLYLNISGNIDGSISTVKFVKKCYRENIDVFNCMYLSKKLFLTRNAYYDFIKNKLPLDVVAI